MCVCLSPKTSVSWGIDCTSYEGLYFGEFYRFLLNNFVMVWASELKFCVLKVISKMRLLMQLDLWNSASHKRYKEVKLEPCYSGSKRSSELKFCENIVEGWENVVLKFGKKILRDGGVIECWSPGIAILMGTIRVKVGSRRYGALRERYKILKGNNFDGKSGNIKRSMCNKCGMIHLDREIVQN